MSKLKRNKPDLPWQQDLYIDYLTEDKKEDRRNTIGGSSGVQRKQKHNRPDRHAEADSWEVWRIRERTICELYRLPISLWQCLEKRAKESNETLWMSGEDSKTTRKCIQRYLHRRLGKWTERFETVMGVLQGFYHLCYLAYFWKWLWHWHWMDQTKGLIL